MKNSLRSDRSGATQLGSFLYSFQGNLIKRSKSFGDSTSITSTEPAISGLNDAHFFADALENFQDPVELPVSMRGGV